MKQTSEILRDELTALLAKYGIKSRRSGPIKVTPYKFDLNPEVMHEAVRDLEKMAMERRHRAEEEERCARQPIERSGERFGV